jgi:Protein of unknown function (DUF3891)
MLLREDDRGLLAIGQPSHAWISGQLARAWGNQRFGVVAPLEEVCLASEQHDVGWADLDLEPSYNPDTGRPRSFTEMPLDVHLSLWTRGPRSLISQSRYVALLASLHGWRLYQRRDLARLPAAEAEMIRRFLAQQRSFQDDLLASLRAEEATASLADEAEVERNSLLVWTWDYLSLALCLDWAPVTAKGAPTATERVDLELTPGDEPGTVHLEPWPFYAPSLTVRCEGRRLAGRFQGEDEMRVAFDRAPWESLELRLERC